ncbi:MFS transporter, partial [Streptomyces sp. SID5785]|nr:MFS transporter [Streptomyces sp. SID5785]
FVHGLHVTLVVSAVLLLAGALAALKLPRRMECEESAPAPSPEKAGSAGTERAGTAEVGAPRRPSSRTESRTEPRTQSTAV